MRDAFSRDYMVALGCDYTTRDLNNLSLVSLMVFCNRRLVLTWTFLTTLSKSKD